MKQTDRESRTRWIKLTAFFGVLAVLCVIGIFLPRPTESEIEKRKLTEFPAFTWESFWSGKWFSGIGMPIPTHCGSCSLAGIRWYRAFTASAVM